MDAFFEGLDCRLRVSGMVADSIMMGIVNSAMEVAYRKSCSKEGDLERLNEKTRFCELAILQLDWCLKYVQEVIDDSIVDSTFDREQLLSDLLETRDRIHNRLDETELVIVEKDVELMRRKENEIKLRLALEVKGEEVSSLSNALGLQRVEEERANDSAEDHNLSVSRNDGHVFSELESSLNKQISKIRSRLDDGRHIVGNLLQNVRTGFLGGTKFNPGYDGNGDQIKTLHELHEMAQLKLDLEEMVMDSDILKEEIRSSFQTIVNSVSLFKEKMEEQQWAWNAEKDTVNLVTRNFLKDVQCQYNVEMGACPVVLDMNWSAFMDDITSLHDELKVLISQLDVLSKSDSIMELRIERNPSSSVNIGNKSNLERNISQRSKNSLVRYHSDGAYGKLDDFFSDLERHEGLIDSGYNAGKSGDMDGQYQENQPGLVADLIKNHESIIQRKTQEINWLKGELNREKDRHFSPGNDSTYSFVREIIVKVISLLERIKEKENLVATSCQHGTLTHKSSTTIFQQNLSFSDTADKGKKVICTSGEIYEEPSNTSCCHLLHAELCEEIRQIKEERFEIDIKAVILDETYGILLKDLLKKLILDCFDINTKMLVREDMHRVIIGEMVKEFIDEGKSNITWQYLKEQSNWSCCHLLHAELYEEIREMKEEKAEMEIKTVILEDNYKILFESMMRLHSDRCDVEIEMLVRKDIYGVILSELVKGCYDQGRAQIVLQCLKEEIDCIVLSKVVKDVIGAQNLILTRSQLEERGLNIKLYQVSETSEKIVQAQKVDMLFNSFKLEKGLDFVLTTGSEEPCIHVSDVGETKESDDNNLQDAQLMAEKSYVYDSVDKKPDIGFSELVTSKLQLGEIVSSYGPSLYDSNVVCYPISASPDRIHDGTNCGCLPEEFGEKHENSVQFIFLSLEKFSQAIMDFEHMAYERIRIYASRLDGLIFQFSSIIKQVNFVKKNELLYRKAFTRRCYDLQTAEAEVDLLGDEVDMLLNLVEKVYVALNYYLPNLQHYSEITDILSLMKKKLDGEVTDTSRQF